MELLESSVPWLLCHSACPPIDMHAAHANKHKEDVIKLLKDIMPIASAMLIKQCNNNDATTASKNQIKSIGQ